MASRRVTKMWTRLASRIRFVAGDDALPCEFFDDVGVGTQQGFEAVSHLTGDFCGIDALGEAETRAAVAQVVGTRAGHT